MLTRSAVEAAASLDMLVARFLACTLPHDQWTHATHLAVGLWHVDRYGASEALDRLRQGIRRLNDSHGTVNSGNSGYHETITGAYVKLLDGRRKRVPGNEAG